ncbi:hypothetical protein BU251_02385 [Candidatus Velamenicoccus archaeovorus]|uniref:Uncharacterized protein n=1 Tax=Velamenicoccus archaeovorus TaxID=1930593 RepID=A0A410P3C4_VELA1|nr:hypothetical protein [Candidatus Velamenicoccus archaeovorus]QAT16656.1 hypothetical protein BU251_02385 [Candidatus Velamenicoccus archaeovorus]
MRRPVALYPFHLLLVCLIIFICTTGYCAAQDIKGPVPGIIISAAENTEDAIDRYRAGDWEGAKKVVDDITLKSQDIEDMLISSTLPTSSLYEFGYLLFRLNVLTSDRKSADQAALTANQITALLLDLQNLYEQIIPGEIGWMDYLGREIALLSKVGESHGLLNKRIEQLSSVWGRLKPRVEEKKGLEVIAEMDRTINELKVQRSHSRITILADTMLELVDKLETLFEK